MRKTFPFSYFNEKTKENCIKKQNLLKNPNHFYFLHKKSSINILKNLFSNLFNFHKEIDFSYLIAYINKILLIRRIIK